MSSHPPTESPKIALSPDPACVWPTPGAGSRRSTGSPFRIGIEDAHEIGCWLGRSRKAHQAHLVCAALRPPFSPLASDAPDEVCRKTF